MWLFCTRNACNARARRRQVPHIRPKPTSAITPPVSCAVICKPEKYRERSGNIIILRDKAPFLKDKSPPGKQLLVFAQPGRLQHGPENDSGNDLAPEDACNAGSRRGVRLGNAGSSADRS